ncbi:hypothetical protein U1Q18_037583, partial [Sarracenia purpurea var. burkii]
MVSPIRRQGPHIPDRNLNFEEFGSQLGNSGKPLNLMNLEDLVKNVIYADEAGLSFQNSSSFSSSPPASNFLGNFNLNGTLNRKTVDEVWKEIVHQEHVRAAESRKSVQQQLPLMAIDPMVVVPHQQEDWFKFPMATGESNFQVSEMGSENLENHLALPLALSMVPASSSDCRPGVRRKDSVTDEAVEKTIERRQERMMKNRESAARSRARKQVGAAR